MINGGIEPATSPVWRVRDNHYTKETDVYEEEINLIVLSGIQSL